MPLAIVRHKVLLYKSIIRPVMSYGSQIWGSAGMCHLKRLHTLTNSFLRQIVNAPWFVRNEVIYRDLKIKPFLPHIKNLSKRFFDKLPSVPNELIRNQPAYDPASGKWHGIYGVPVPKSGRTSSSELIKK
ncbi:RNA-directed DNA polymerase from mobile element jockey [Trichonephila clavipes]|nr:RNA-directed DNA polymerase from mobile element jockey [Trichonephila clavipes]